MISRNIKALLIDIISANLNRINCPEYNKIADEIVTEICSIFSRLKIRVTRKPRKIVNNKGLGI